VTLVKPRADTTITGTTTIRFSAIPVSPATILRREIYIDGSFLDTADTDSTYSWNTLGYVDGQHTVQVKAIDNNGKSGASSLVSVTLFNTPIVFITAPPETLELSGIDTVRFSVQYAPGSAKQSTKISFDGGNWLATSGDSSHVWTTTTFLDGSHTVQIQATGTNGKAGVSQIKLYSVNNKPRITVALPVAGDTVAGPLAVSFAATAVSPSVIQKTWISVDGGVYDTTATDSTALINTKLLADGSHIFKIRVQDDTRKISESDARLFIVDNTVPLMADPKTVYPENGASARSGTEVLVTLLVKDLISGLRQDSAVVLFAAGADIMPAVSVMHDDGLSGDKVASDNIFSAMVQVISAQTGPIPFSVTATDALGNSKTLTSAILLDNIKPVTGIFLKSPRDSSIINASDVVFYSHVILKGTYSDAGGSMIRRAVVTVKDDSGSYVGNSPVSLTTKDSLITLVVPLGTGKNSITLMVEDNAGNWDDTTITLNNADMIVPRIAYDLVPNPETAGTPAVKATYFEKLVMKGTYSDLGGSHMERVFISVLNDSMKNVNNSPIDLSPKDSVFSRIINLVTGRNIIMFTAADHAGNKISKSDTVYYFEPKQTRVIGVAGGTVSAPDSAQVTVPQNALIGSIEITIKKVADIDEPKPLDTSVSLLHVAHDFGPNGTVFRTPVTITLPYTDADLDVDQNGLRDIDPMKLTVVFWDGKTWQTVGGSAVDTVNRLVSVQVNHFTIYDLAQNTAAAPAALKAYWTRNPIVESGDVSTFNFELPQPGRVSLSILDLGGNLVWQVIKKDTRAEAGFNNGKWQWKGQNVSGRFAGAGIYVYLFTYEPDGGRKTIIRKPIGLVR
jgi:hypothetical protein